jgi:hypothetical protein
MHQLNHGSTSLITLYSTTSIHRTQLTGRIQGPRPSCPCSHYASRLCFFSTFSVTGTRRTDTRFEGKPRMDCVFTSTTNMLRAEVQNMRFLAELRTDHRETLQCTSVLPRMMVCVSKRRGWRRPTTPIRPPTWKGASCCPPRYLKACISTISTPATLGTDARVGYLDFRYYIPNYCHALARSTVCRHQPPSHLSTP